MSPSLTEDERSFGLPPFVQPGMRVLLLGSLPGAASLAACAYYAHPRNQFWRLVSAVIGETELSNFTYAKRLQLLGHAGIGLWDVYASAVRQGSLDTAIRSARHTDLAKLVKSLPHLRAVAFNGAKASIAGRKALAGVAQNLIDLPSSSPAHAAMTFDAKLQRWLQIKEFLAAPLNPAAPMDIGRA